MNIEAILQKTDLFELVRMAGGEPDRNGRCACPIHGGKDKNNFHVYTDAGKQRWKCFSHDCGGGDALDFVQKIILLHFSEKNLLYIISDY